MENSDSELWTIDKLGAEVARALAVGYEGAVNGRVRDVPDLRTIRYYTTLGLLDRPAEMQGRTALYGRRHLLQLVAIKKLQARGLSLAEVQQRMAGATDAILGSLASGAIETEGAAACASAGPERNVPARSFWKSRPASIAERLEAPIDSIEPDRHGDERPSVGFAYQEMQPLQAIGLADQVMLLLASTGPIAPEELPAIRKAAAPLIQHLRHRRLIQPRPKGEGDDQATSTTDRRGTAPPIDQR
jgi:DNA-binding transcriptional MerR regulator